MKFYNLHQHSNYSVLDGLSKVDTMVDFAKEQKLKAIALTEHGTLSSAYELWDKCNKADITPVLGLEAYFVDDINQDEGITVSSYSHVILLCQNETGWNNLKEIQWLAWRDGYYKMPRIDYSMLRKHTDGLICCSACVGGLIGSIVLRNKYYDMLTKGERKTALADRMKKFKKLFPKRFYLELMLSDMEIQTKVNKRVIKLSKQHKIPMVVTNDSHYVYKEDCHMHDVIRCIAWKGQLKDENNGTYDIHELYNATLKDMKKFRRKYHKYITEDVIKTCVKNSEKIINTIERYPIRTEKSALPKFVEDAKGMLKDICMKGKKKYLKGKWNDEYKARLKYELGVINKLGMADYFLIVWDIAQEARRKNIPFNTRGSVAGSLVAFLIGISWIDPIRFNTNFERFLTEDRLSLPDIDMDFGKARRMELVQYLRDKYGKECVAHITNFSKFKPRGAIKDVARVYGIPFSTTNKITKLIPDGTSKWEDIPSIAEVNEFLEENEEIAECAEELMGVIRHRGVHASGVILTPGNIIEWTPIAWSVVNEDEAKDKVTEFDMYALEDMNILKLDFLGQNTLDVIQHTLDIMDGKMKTFDDLMAVILDDINNDEVYKYIRTGQLVGTFQMGTSEGMRTLIQEVKPKNIFDIIDCIALYRTAILTVGAHRRYIDRKFGRENIHYLHPKMKKVLHKTQGIMLWQEQPMELAIHLAGFTPTESDHFRKGIKLKDKEKFDKWRSKFIKGCKKKSNINKDTAGKIWHEIEQWSGYGFNVAHATSYGVIAYITAWLKYYHPAEFMTALLSHNTDNDDKLNTYLHEVKRMGLKLVKPSINNSGDNFVYKNGKMLYPLSVIKQAGTKAIENILTVRKEGKFKSVDDFYKRVKKSVVNVGVINNLVFANCFRKFGSVDKVYNKFSEIRGKDSTIRALYCRDCKGKYPVSLTAKKIENNGAICPECGSIEVVTEQDLIRKKKFNLTYCKNTVFGFTMDDPMKPYLGEIIKYNAITPCEAEDYEGSRVSLAGMVSKIKKHIDKNGNEMAFVAVTDGKETTDMVVFASVWSEDEELINKNNVYIFRGKISDGSLLLGDNGIRKLILKKA